MDSFGLNSVREGECVPQDWSDSILAPILKKKNLSHSDNWYHITLVDVAVKAVAHFVQSSVQSITECILLESWWVFFSSVPAQTGFVSARQFGEKALKHNTQALWDYGGDIPSSVPNLLIYALQPP